MEIGTQIKRARTKAGLSQRDLANAVGVTHGLVGQWESHRKKPGRDNLLAIASACVVTVEALAGDGDLEEGTVPISDPFEKDLVRAGRLLKGPAKQNLRQMVQMAVNISREAEKQRGPLKVE